MKGEHHRLSPLSLQFVLSYYVSLHSELHVLMSYYLSIKTMLGSSLPPVVCGRAHFLFVFVYIYIVVFNTYCVVFLLCLSLSCQFLWIVHFCLPLQYSLTFIYIVQQRMVWRKCCKTFQPSCDEVSLAYGSLISGCRVHQILSVMQHFILLQIEVKLIHKLYMDNISDKFQNHNFSTGIFKVMPHEDVQSSPLDNWISYGNTYINK